MENFPHLSPVGHRQSAPEVKLTRPLGEGLSPVKKGGEVNGVRRSAEPFSSRKHTFDSKGNRPASAEPFPLRKPVTEQRVEAIPTESLSPSQKSRREHATSADVRLADLMDDDEKRWMTGMDGSRSSTPTKGMAVSQTYPAPSGTPPPPAPQHSDELSTSRNETPPLPPERPSIYSMRGPPVAFSGVPSHTSTPKQHGTFLAVPSFAQRVFQAGKCNLLYDITERHRLPWRFRDVTHGVLDLSTLQKMQQYVLQQKLVEQVRALGEKGAWLDIGIGETLSEYCRVVHNLETMEQHSHRDSAHDPFLITTARSLESRLLEEAGLARRNSHYDFLDTDTLPRFPAMQRGRNSAQQALYIRPLLALAAGLALLVPYLIVTFAPGKIAPLVTVCGCVALFALVVALGARGVSRRFVVALTLGYAAALVIFVGVRPARFNA